MKKCNTEFSVGLFMIVGIVGFFYLALSLAGLGLSAHDHYIIEARFVSASGLKTGSDVELAGVNVGYVAAVRFDPKDFQAVVDISIPKGIEIQEDAIASIRSTGIIGSKFLKITPGGTDVILQPGEEIRETESSVNFEELLSKYIFDRNPINISN